MNIYFSNNDNLGTLDRFLNRLDLCDQSTLHIHLNPKWVNVHTAVLALTAALALQIGKKNSHIDLKLPRSANYLERMGLYQFLNEDFPTTISHKDESGRFIPITIVKNQADQSRLITDLIPLLHLSPEKSDIIKYIFGELIRNVLEHSMAKDGAVVAAQFYPKSNRIGIGICDTGIGLRKSLERYHYPTDDLDAIRLALTPGISGTTDREGGTEDNAGAGLFFVKSLAKITRSYFVIYSGNSEYKLKKHPQRIINPRLNIDPFNDGHSSLENISYFSGTLVGVDIVLNNTAEFDDLLERIRKVYGEAIRERKKRRCKEPKFV
jgi:anti-sigma regulatory factor (Ser/Thr protein kinase)